MNPAYMGDEITQLRTWVRRLPASHMVYPKTSYDRLKYIFWRFLTPVHPYLRDMLTFSRIVRHRGRQEYLLGTITPEVPVKDFITHLLNEGYGNHFVAWKDEGQLASLRYVCDFKHQYHIRIFEDREVRAHYEYTPECHPILHMQEENMEDRSEEFLRIIGHMITPIQ